MDAANAGKAAANGSRLTSSMLRAQQGLRYVHLCSRFAEVFATHVWPFKPLHPASWDDTTVRLVIDRGTLVAGEDEWSADNGDDGALKDNRVLALTVFTALALGAQACGAHDLALSLYEQARAHLALLFDTCDIRVAEALIALLYLAFGFGDLERAAYYNMTALTVFNKLKAFDSDMYRRCMWSVHLLPGTSYAERKRLMREYRQHTAHLPYWDESPSGGSRSSPALAGPDTPHYSSSISSSSGIANGHGSSLPFRVQNTAVPAPALRTADVQQFGGWETRVLGTEPVRAEAASSLYYHPPPVAHLHHHQQHQQQHHQHQHQQQQQHSSSVGPVMDDLEDERFREFSYCSSDFSFGMLAPADFYAQQVASYQQPVPSRPVGQHQQQQQQHYNLQQQQQQQLQNHQGWPAAPVGSAYASPAGGTYGYPPAMTTSTTTTTTTTTPSRTPSIASTPVTTPSWSTPSPPVLSPMRAPNWSATPSSFSSEHPSPSSLSPTSSPTVAPTDAVTHQHFAAAERVIFHTRYTGYQPTEENARHFLHTMIVLSVLDAKASRLHESDPKRVFIFQRMAEKASAFELRIRRSQSIPMSYYQSVLLIIISARADCCWRMHDEIFTLVALQDFLSLCRTIDMRLCASTALPSFNAVIQIMQQLEQSQMLVEIVELMAGPARQFPPWAAVRERVMRDLVHVLESHRSAGRALYLPTC